MTVRVALAVTPAPEPQAEAVDTALPPCPLTISHGRITRSETDPAAVLQRQTRHEHPETWQPYGRYGVTRGSHAGTDSQ